MTILPNGVAVTGATHYTEWCAKHGLEHDKFMCSFLRELVPRERIRNVLQGGAHIGTLTKPLLDSGCRVLAVEPNYDARGCLLQNCSNDRYSLSVVAGALGELSGRTSCLTIINEENSGATYCAEGAGVTRIWSIDWLTHDSTGAPKFVPDLILLDIEGWEPKALRGTRNLFAKVKPLLILEVNSFALERAGESSAGLFALLHELGYGWEIIQPEISDINAPQYDILCRPLKK